MPTHLLIVDDSPTIREIIKIYLMGGDFEFLDADNKAVLAFTRKIPGQTVLCVNNLSQHVQTAVGRTIVHENYFRRTAQLGERFIEFRV